MYISVSGDAGCIHDSCEELSSSSSSPKVAVRRPKGKPDRHPLTGEG